MTDGTAQGYQAGVEKWKEYLSTLDTENQPGQYLENMTCTQGKAKRMVLFMAYLYMSEGLRDEQIKRAVTSVSYMFEIEGRDTSFSTSQWYPEEEQRRVVRARNLESTTKIGRAKLYYQYA